jgi:hypothetical protein
VPVVALLLSASACMSEFDDNDHALPTDDYDFAQRAEDDDAKSDEDGYCIGCDDEDTKTPPDDGEPAPVDDEPPECSTSTCEDATDLGTVAGDTGTDQRSRQGSGSAWFTVYVAETNFSPVGHKMRLKATLVSPEGSNYDVFIRGDRCGGPVEAESTEPAGSTDSATAEWGEGFAANNKEDSRQMYIEVRHVSGACDPGRWTLLVSGNTP